VDTDSAAGTTTSSSRRNAAAVAAPPRAIAGKEEAGDQTVRVGARRSNDDRRVGARDLWLNRAFYTLLLSSSSLLCLV
jgi:hypothetical protein